MAFTIAGMLLGSKARTIPNLIRPALRTTFPSVLLCGLSAFVLDRRFVHFACDKINEGSEFGRKKTVRRVNCGNPCFILRGVHFVISQNNFELTTVKLLFHYPSWPEELPEALQRLRRPDGGVPHAVAETGSICSLSPCAL